MQLSLRGKQQKHRGKECLRQVQSQCTIVWQCLRNECSLHALPPIFLVLALCSCVLLGFTHPRKLKCPSLNFFASSICLSRSLPCLFIRMSTTTSNSPIKHEITLTSTPALFISFCACWGTPDGSWGQKQVAGLSSKHLYPLSHLTSPKPIPPKWPIP